MFQVKFQPSKLPRTDMTLNNPILGWVVYLYPKCISCLGEPRGSSKGVQTGIVVQTVVHFVPGLPGLANTFWIRYTRYAPSPPNWAVRRWADIAKGPLFTFFLSLFPFLSPWATFLTEGFIVGV